MIENKTITSRIRVAFIYLFVICAGLLCFIPMWNVVCISFSSSEAVTANRVTIFPVGFRLESYIKILEDQQFWTSFRTSSLRVLLGWMVNIVLILLMAYPLSKTEEEFRGRNIYMGILIFAMLFSGGMVPTYLVVKELGLVNTIWSLVLVGAVPIFNVIMVKNFFQGIPKALEEAALIDGATPMQIMLRVYLPCSKPVVATVSLFSIVGHWNDYMKGVLYMTKIKLYPLMTYIRNINVDMQELLSSGAGDEELLAAAMLSSRTLNAAKIVVATIPLLMIYPLLQKYLITGITIGAVKE